MRFEVKRITDVRSVVKAFRDKSFEVMFWKRLVRLAVAFGASITAEAQQILAEVEKIELDDTQRYPSDTGNSSEKEGVFISYSRKDKEYVNTLYEAFESRSVDVWMDKKIQASANWLETLRTQIEKSSCFVLVMSSSSCASENVQNEILHAQRMGKTIFPLLLEGEGCWFLATKQYIDVRNKSLPSETFFSEVRDVIDEARKT